MTISLRDAPGTFLLRMNAAVTNSLLLTCSPEMSSL
jgi:hypothetical protein